MAQLREEHFVFGVWIPIDIGEDAPSVDEQIYINKYSTVPSWCSVRAEGHKIILLGKSTDIDLLLTLSNHVEDHITGMGFWHAGRYVEKESQIKRHEFSWMNGDWRSIPESENLNFLPVWDFPDGVTMEWIADLLARILPPDDPEDED